MAAKEIYDYVGAVTPDVDVTLALEAQGYAWLKDRVAPDAVR